MERDVKEDDLSRLCTVLQEVMEEEALSRFGRIDGAEVVTKSSAEDLVTVADQAVEARIGAWLRETYPEALIVGEETAEEDPSLLDQIGSAALSFIIDPIDGTWNYANGVPLFGAILAVCRKGEPVGGLLLDPVRGHAILATKGAGLRAWTTNGTTALAKPHGANCHSLNGFLPMMLLPRASRPALAAAMVDLGRVQSLRCSCHEYRLFAQGLADFVVTGLAAKPWDHAVGALVARERDGVARFLDGAPYSAARTTGPLIIARDDETWERVAKCLRTSGIG